MTENLEQDYQALRTAFRIFNSCKHHQKGAHFGQALDGHLLGAGEVADAFAARNLHSICFLGALWAADSPCLTRVTNGIILNAAASDLALTADERSSTHSLIVLNGQLSRAAIQKIFRRALLDYDRYWTKAKGNPAPNARSAV